MIHGHGRGGASSPYVGTSLFVYLFFKLPMTLKVLLCIVLFHFVLFPLYLKIMEDSLIEK
jgi:hypothetical protein